MPLLQSAPPKRFGIVVLIPLARADVCLQFKNDVVMTVQQFAVLGQYANMKIDNLLWTLAHLSTGRLSSLLETKILHRHHDRERKGRVDGRSDSVRQRFVHFLSQ